MSRMINRLHLSPTTSRVRLIGHPDLWPSLIHRSAVKNRLQYCTTLHTIQSVAECNQLQWPPPLGVVMATHQWPNVQCRHAKRSRRSTKRGSNVDVVLLHGRLHTASAGHQVATHQPRPPN